MVMKNCVVCGEEFDAKGNAITCSKKCSIKRRQQNRKQYRQNNKEKVNEYRRQYYQKNKETVKEYQREYQRQYYQDNKEKVKEYQRQYRQDNKEKINEQRRQYYQDNKEKERERSRQYRQKNKEKLKEQSRRYRQENREKINKQRRQYYQDNKEKERERRRQYYQKNKEKVKEYYQNNREKIIEYQIEYQKEKYEQVYKELSKKYDISIEDLKVYLPLFIVKRELDCFDQGSYFLDLFIPAHERANGKCEITGKKTKNLVVHHLNGYNWCVEGRMDLDNVVVICEELHIAFHNKYGYGDNTEEQFWKFVEEWEKGLVTLDDFMEE